MKTQAGPDGLISRYLADLDHALGPLPARRRHQIIEGVSAHIVEARRDVDEEDEASVRALLDRVGDPEVIAAEAGAGEVPVRSRRSDAWVPWLLLLGGFVFVVGWFVGLGLLWSSMAWRLRDKLIGTLLLPGGLAAVVLPLGLSGGSQTTCANAPVPVAPGTARAAQNTVAHCVSSGFSLPQPIGMTVLALAVVVPILTAIHLERVRRTN